MNKICLYSIAALLMLTMTVGAGASRPGMMACLADDSTTTAAKEVPSAQPASIIDEVVWVVGDEPILKSDIESMRMQGEMEGMKWEGNPDCTIPEQLAVQKLFLHQAAIDSIEVTESDISQSIDDQINYWIQLADGSREKLEEYRNMTISQMRQQMHDEFKNRELIQKMRQQLVKDISVSPAEVRKFFERLPEDSIPLVPTTVEVQIITRQPKVSIEEVNRVKDALREYTDSVNRGETTFATMARLYSEDGSARQGGEIG